MEKTIKETDDKLKKAEKLLALKKEKSTKLTKEVMLYNGNEFSSITGLEIKSTHIPLSLRTTIHFWHHIWHDLKNVLFK